MTTATIAEKNQNAACKLHCRKILASVNLPALSEIFARLKSPSILGGNPSKKDADRFSYWAAEPKEVFEFQAGQKNPFEKLQYALDKYKLEGNYANGLPKGIFCGGWIGYFSYELGRYI
ncbi:MAG: hypothetical protein WC454_08165, partial [Phycisphaerae bacterium]